jgi:hypothetical protein
MLTGHTMAEFSKDNLVIAIGAKVESILTKRGLITYGSEQVIPIFAIDIFSPDLQLIGSGLYYKYQFSNTKFNYRFRYNFNATNDSPLYESSEADDKRIEREQTSEIDNMFEFETKNHYTRILFSKDIIEHMGLFTELHIRQRFYEHKIGKKNLVLKYNLFYETGHGDNKHNNYLYGINKSDITYHSYGINLSTPEVIDSFWPVIQFERFELLNSARDGVYVDEKAGYKFSALMAFKVW